MKWKTNWSQLQPTCLQNHNYIQKLVMFVDSVFKCFFFSAICAHDNSYMVRERLWLWHINYGYIMVNTLGKYCSYSKKQTLFVDLWRDTNSGLLHESWTCHTLITQHQYLHNFTLGLPTYKWMGFVKVMCIIFKRTDKPPILSWREEIWKSGYSKSL